MEIINESGSHFDIPTDYSLDLELINPILDDVGSQSAPGTLPFTARNLEMLDFPDRMDRAKKYTIKRNVTLRQGTFIKKATQAVLKANRKEKIVTTFYFDEAIFYEKIKGLNLTSLNYRINTAFPTAKNPSVQVCRDFIFEVMAQNQTAEFHVFPISTKLETYPGLFDMIEKPDILNLTEHDSSNNLIKLRDWSQRTDKVDNAVITYPPGYGITFFLKVSYILDSICKELGYSVGVNIFETHPELRQLVIVNDVADTIVRGYVEYQQLVPDMTVSDFLTHLKKKFGLCIIMDESNKQIHFELLEDILNLKPDWDLTEFLTDYPQIEWATPKQVKLSAGTSLPFSNTETELYEDFVKIHGEPKEFKFLEPIVLNKVYFHYSTLTYFMYITDNADQQNKQFRISSPNFKYYTKDSIELEELESGDEQLAETSLLEIVGNDPASGVTKFEGYILPIVGSRRNANTTLYINNEAQNNSETNMALMFCFRAPAMQANGKKSKVVGTPYPYSSVDNKWGNLSLTYQGEDGLYNKLWKTYDNCLRNSFHTVRCSMNIPFIKLQQLKLHTPKLLFNQPVLIERIKCKIGNGKCEITEAIFRTLRPYED